jgi:hypothetical protein
VQSGRKCKRHVRVMLTNEWKPHLNQKDAKTGHYTSPQHISDHSHNPRLFTSMQHNYRDILHSANINMQFSRHFLNMQMMVVRN